MSKSKWSDVTTLKSAGIVQARYMSQLGQGDIKAITLGAPDLHLYKVSDNLADNNNLHHV